jgi:hypothetical protein
MRASSWGDGRKHDWTMGKKKMMECLIPGGWNGSVVRRVSAGLMGFCSVEMGISAARHARVLRLREGGRERARRGGVLHGMRVDVLLESLAPCHQDVVDGGWRLTVDGGRWTVDGGRWTVDGWRLTVDGYG